MEKILMEKAGHDVDEADLVLVGIGTEFCAKDMERTAILDAYNKLANILKGKNYFIVTVCTDDVIFESELDTGRIVAPCGSEKKGNVITDENYDESWYLPQWNKYRLWLQGTVNKKLCILELGVGFEYPTVVRFAFEKIAYFNQKCTMYRVHEKFAQLTPEIKERCTAVPENAVSFVSSLQ